MAPPLSYGSTFGYYGLRVNPTLEQVVGSVRKPLRIPLPDRRAKEYALGPYRALILDAAQKANDYDQASIDYRNSGHHLPEAAARVRPSSAGHDPTFPQYDREHAASETQHAYETAFDLMNEEHRRQTAQTRHEQLRHTYGPNRMHPVIEASHDEFEEAGVPHYMPGPRFTPPRRAWATPHQQMVAYGQPQAREFPTFEALNMGQLPVRAAGPTRAENVTYERLRDAVVGPTWST
jgi:hypothetical protein